MEESDEHMLAIIGGSGLYQLDGLTVETQHEVTTPFGQPSSSITEGSYLGQPVLFLARHGEGHQKAVPSNHRGSSN